VSVIECPNCRKPIQLTDLRAGRFVPGCPHCGVLFELTVSEDLARPPLVTKLAEARESGEDFALLSLPEGAFQPVSPESGNLVRDILERIRAKLSQYRVAGLPKGIPRLVDEGHYVVLRQDGQGFYGPRFSALPWCGGALRTIWMLPPDLGHDPYYASRWVGEMIIAGELAHPNLEPYQSAGEARRLFLSPNTTPADTRGLFYAAKTRARTTPAAALVKAEMSPETRRQLAAALILQAARGLKFAHEQGVYHRDLRPENLVVDSHGTVRVINFGLDSHAFLDDAKRQRQLAITADKKDIRNGQAPLPPIDRQAELQADFVGLGRTWLALSLDQPDAMTWARESLPAKVETLGPTDSAILRKLLAQSPDEGYKTMGEVVQVLEVNLGVRSPGAVAQGEALKGLIRESVDQIGRASNLVLRGFILKVAAGLWVSLLVLFLLGGLWKLELNFLVLGGMTAGWIAALADPSRERHSGLVSLFFDALQATSAAILAFITLLVAGLFVVGIVSGYLGSWILFGLLSLGLALAREIGVGRAAALEWRAATEPISRRMADLRLSGIPEEILRNWFDTAQIPSARDLRSWLFRATEPRELEADADFSPRPATWVSGLPSIRESVGRFLADRVQSHRDRRHRAVLTRVETDRLVARGVNRLTAARRGRRVGAAVMSVIADWRLTRLWNSGSRISLRPDLQKDLRQSVWEAVDDPERTLESLEGPSSWLVRKLGMVSRVALGRLVRLSFGIAMLILFAIWLDREGIVTWSDLSRAGAESYKAAGRAVESQDPGELRGIQVPLPKDHHRLWEAWNEPLIDREWSRSLSGANLAVAGFLLVFSAFFERFSIGLFAILGSIVVLVGPVLAKAELSEAVNRNTTAVWLIAGGVVAAIGFFVRPRHQHV